MLNINVNKDPKSSYELDGDLNPFNHLKKVTKSITQQKRLTKTFNVTSIYKWV